MTMRKPLVAGNWKMHGTLQSGRALTRALLSGLAAHPDGPDVLICPAFPHLGLLADTIDGASLLLGAQDLSEQPGEGAFTGDVSGAMLVDVGCTYVLVGHSERRSVNGESDGQVAAKFSRAQEAGLIPILCVGESLAERQAGATEAVIQRQLDAVLKGVGVGGLKHAVVAYEPVWAIGTGQTATPEQAQAVHAFIRAKIAAQDATIAGQLRILYGGSVKSGNARELFAMGDIDGGLVGGASLTAPEFLKIIEAAS
jgi:triosephosphate isomerase